jgi:chromosome segregation ATPase
VETYEHQFSDLREQVKLSSSRILELEELLTDQERLFQDKISVENKLVATQRSFSEAKAQYEENLNQLQEGLAEFRREAKERSLEVDRLNKEMGLIKSQRDELSTSKRELEDRIESLECLWRDNHQQHEQLKERHQALQNLNQQLSTSLIEQRREVNLLKEQRDANHLQTSTKIRELEGQVKYLGATAVRTNEQQQKSSEAEPSQRRELVQRIEKLISEIQSGFSPAPVDETGDQVQDSYQDPPPI